MKYQVGEKVKYDSGDWWFYGTVSAVIENAICPCYRMNVERMEKKNCKFSITQFEFELEAYSDLDVSIENGNWDKSENEYIKKLAYAQNNDNLPQVIPVSEQKTDTKPTRKPELKPEKQIPEEQIPENADTPYISTIDPPKRKRGDAWAKNLEMYLKGVKTNNIYTWVTHNRRQYNSGNLAEDKLEKLIEINFPFEKKKPKQKEKTLKGEV